MWHCLIFTVVVDNTMPRNEHALHAKWLKDRVKFSRSQLTTSLLQLFSVSIYRRPLGNPDEGHVPSLFIFDHLVSPTGPDVWTLKLTIT